MGETEPISPEEIQERDAAKRDLRPLFALGQIVGTPGALAALAAAEQSPLELLVRHITGDWGVVPDEDRKANDRAVEQEQRILSSYRLGTGEKVWVITEWDRSVTTLLLPLEY